MHEKGFFDLQRPTDLLAKLKRELQRMEAEPLDVDHAFNFFVTAEHILDWLHPGDANKAMRRQAREASKLLQLVSHIANGAKHFVAEASHHKSMGGTAVVHRHDVKLCVVVTNFPELAFGSERMLRSAVEIARLVHQHWTSELHSQSAS